MIYCIYCDETPCTCTPDEVYARKHPNLTDQERAQIRKGALYERHEAKADLALHREKVTSIASALRDVARIVESRPAAELVARSIPLKDEVVHAVSQYQSATERLRAAERRCEELGLD